MKWEYLFLKGLPLHKRLGADLDRDLEGLGRQGWEATGMARDGDGGWVSILLKRPVPDE